MKFWAFNNYYLIELSQIGIDSEVMKRLITLNLNHELIFGIFF